MLTTSSVAAVIRRACWAATAVLALRMPCASSTARPSRRGMMSCSDAAISVATIAIDACQGWRSVSRVFDAESLAPLLGISVSSLRRYQAGTRATPDDVAARLHFLALVISDLAGAYNEIGVRRWFHRERSLLDDKTPGALLSGDWNPEDEGPQRVRDLARSLVMLSTT